MKCTACGRIPASGEIVPPVPKDAILYVVLCPVCVEIGHRVGYVEWKADGFSVRYFLKVGGGK